MHNSKFIARYTYEMNKFIWLIGLLITNSSCEIRLSYRIHVKVSQLAVINDHNFIYNQYKLSMKLSHNVLISLCSILGSMFRMDNLGQAPCASLLYGHGSYAVCVHIQWAWQSSMITNFLTALTIVWLEPNCIAPVCESIPTYPYLLIYHELS